MVLNDAVYSEIMDNRDHLNNNNLKHINVHNLKAIEYQDNNKNLIGKAIFCMDYIVDMLPEKDLEARCGFINQLIYIHLDIGNFKKAKIYLDKLKLFDKERKFQENIKKFEVHLSRLNR